MVSRDVLFRECVSLMDKSGIDSSYFDTLCIFQDILNDRNPLFRPSEIVPDDKKEIILNLVKRRTEGYPLQYLLGQWEFYGYTFKVNENVLIPRPDTEVLIENIIEICRKNNLKSPKIADLCSGSGCIGITLKKQIPDSEVYAVEISEKAVETIRENAELNKADINIINADVLKRETAESFSELDIIVCNPPYLTQHDMETLQKEVTFEPALALFGGDDGLDFYRKITSIWRNSLRDNGWLAYEYGDGQHEDVGKILYKNNFYNITFSRDTQNIIRTVTARKQEEL